VRGESGALDEKKDHRIAVVCGSGGGRTVTVIGDLSDANPATLFLLRFVSSIGDAAAVAPILHRRK